MKKKGLFTILAIVAAVIICVGAAGLTLSVVIKAADFYKEYKTEIGGLFDHDTKTIDGEENETAPETKKAAAPEEKEEKAKETDSPIRKVETGGTAYFNDVSDIVEECMPCVVSITSKSDYTAFSFFGYGAPETREASSSGSGIIIGENDTEYLIVTNNHVVENSKELNVQFIDGETVTAVMKGGDPEADIAVIGVNKSDTKSSTKKAIKIAVLGDSDALKVGQGVIAIGNAMGYGQSVTVGYVSALDREVKMDEYTTRHLLQTDAAINPGNSGGALINMKGEVIGINSAKLSSTQVEGMGYAIPVTTVMDLIDNLSTLASKEMVPEEKRGYLGIQGQSIDQNMSRMYDMPVGVYVYKIIEGTGAANSDLHEKDIITKIDGQTVRNMEELQNLLAYYAEGDTVNVTVSRLDGEAYNEIELEITLTLKEAIETDVSED